MTTDVLADLAALRRRVRDDRHAYAFPLFLFGALILLASLCYLPTDATEGDLGPFPQFVNGLVRYPALVGWYWVLTIVGGLWLTTEWYRHRARGRGVETDVRVPTAAAVAALLGFIAWQPLFTTLLLELDDDYMGPYSTPAVNLPILFGSAALAVVAGLWGARRTGWARTAGTAVAAFLATVAFGAVSAYFHGGYTALVIIGIALLLLAWAERSVLLSVVGGVFTALALLINLDDVLQIFERLGWFYGRNEQLTALRTLFVPGVILLAGGVVAVMWKRR
jgi:hypothetical protein